METVYRARTRLRSWAARRTGSVSVRVRWRLGWLLCQYSHRYGRPTTLRHHHRGLCGTGTRCWCLERSRENNHVPAILPHSVGTLVTVWFVELKLGPVLSMRKISKKQPKTWVLWCGRKTIWSRGSHCYEFDGITFTYDLLDEGWFRDPANGSSTCGNQVDVFFCAIDNERGYILIPDLNGKCDELNGSGARHSSPHSTSAFFKWTNVER